jgi:ATP-dependent Clp protease ATP-binding subunit ClpA
MWEPFSHSARHAVVRAQEVAQMFGAHFIGTEHMMFALAEADDPVGAALANAVDRDALRRQLGDVSRVPTAEMVFTPGAKRAIELAFENARRLNHNYIGTGHIALGILGTEPPPLVAGHDVTSLRAALEAAASHDGADDGLERWWKRSEREDVNPIADAVDRMLSTMHDFKDGARIKLTIIEPGASKRKWSWLKAPKP